MSGSDHTPITPGAGRGLRLSPLSPLLFNQTLAVPIPVPYFSRRIFNMQEHNITLHFKIT